MLLILALLLLFILEPAAAASSIMDYPMPGTSYEPFFPDAEDILGSLCQHCAMPFYQCIHAAVCEPLLNLYPLL
jgi:hypothetical protein